MQRTGNTFYTLILVRVFRIANQMLLETRPHLEVLLSNFSLLNVLLYIHLYIHMGYLDRHLEAEGIQPYVPWT